MLGQEQLLIAREMSECFFKLRKQLQIRLHPYLAPGINDALLAVSHPKHMSSGSAQILSSHAVIERQEQRPARLYCVDCDRQRNSEPRLPSKS